MPKILFLLLFPFFFASCQGSDGTTADRLPEAIALSGEALHPPPPSDQQLTDLAEARRQYETDSLNIDHIVWYGRRTAYPGFYRDAIAIYSRGIARFPDAPELYRHRGHRYITVRQFDKAITDLERAAQLIRDTEDKIEPDGMPNAKNIPLTTLHSNIWYHLGLAYYLQQEWEKALETFTNCRDLGLNDDNLVSSTHWIYMILRRMGRREAATAALAPIHAEMEIIENQSYWKLCRFYRGELTESELLDMEGADSANDAIRYGLANWYYYNEQETKAQSQWTAIVQSDSWNSFGYIAAEAELAG